MYDVIIALRPSELPAFVDYEGKTIKYIDTVTKRHVVTIDPDESISYWQIDRETKGILQKVSGPDDGGLDYAHILSIIDRVWLDPDLADEDEDIFMEAVYIAFVEN